MIILTGAECSGNQLPKAAPSALSQWQNSSFAYLDRLVHGRSVGLSEAELNQTLGCLISYAPTLLEINPEVSAIALLEDVAKQMERQVHTLMERCAQVLGPDFAAQLEGRQLRKSGDELLAKLNAKSFFQTWVTEWEKELTIQASSRLHSFPVTIEKDVRTNELVPTVNFNEMSENNCKKF